MKIEISGAASGLEVIFCLEALLKYFNAATWANDCAFDSFEAEETATGKTFKIVCSHEEKEKVAYGRFSDPGDLH
jgi:hypothetical protein